jgi:C2H2-type zinc finger
MGAVESRSSSRTPPKEYRCDICGRTFVSIDELNHHKKLDHSQTSKAPAGVS